jgi:cytochrome b561
MADRNAFDTATRIVAGDDGTNYDGVAISLHWATALLVVVQFGLAETWDYFAKTTQDSMQALHMSFGVVLAMVILARLVWRLIPGHQISSLEIGWARAASKGAHYLLYALLVAAVALGFAVQWSRGHPVDVFGLFGIPGPFGPFDRPIRRELKELHNYVAWAIIIIAGLHAAAALYHHYVLKDRVLKRMLPI